MFRPKHKESDQFEIEIKSDFWSKKQFILVNGTLISENSYDMIDMPVISDSCKHYYCIAHISSNGEDYSKVIYDNVEGSLFAGISDIGFENYEDEEVLSYKGINLYNKFRMVRKLIFTEVKIRAQYESMKDCDKFFVFKDIAD